MAYEKKIPVDLECPLRLTQSLIGAKWKPCILDELRDDRSLRPSELHHRLPGSSLRALNIQLNELMEDGLVIRKKYPGLQLHTEYQLTETGKSLLPLIDLMIGWGEEHFELFLKKFGSQLISYQQKRKRK